MSRKANRFNAGRKTVMTKEVLLKLEDAFAFTYTDEEACLYAGISPDTLYRYQKKNPKFSERKEALRLTPNLKAKKILVTSIENSLDQSRWWADKKMKDFQPVIKTETKIEATIVDLAETDMTPEMKSALVSFRKAKEEKLKTIIKQM